MEMNKKTAECGDTFPVLNIPQAAFLQILCDVQMLAKMHRNLIAMYEMESRLKKQHKAYLHVRDEADEMCRIDKRVVDVILDHYTDPENDMRCAVCFSKHLQKEPQKQKETEQKQKTVKPETKKWDVFNLPHDMVMMSVGTLGTMQDDMLALTVAVDQLVDAFRSMVQGGGYSSQQMEKLIRSASELARDVFQRWDDADLNELG